MRYSNLGEHQQVSEISSTPNACGGAVGLERGPILALVSKVRLVDHSGVAPLCQIS